MGEVNVSVLDFQAFTTLGMLFVRDEQLRFIASLTERT
jgi:hypothetical protein